MEEDRMKLKAWKMASAAALSILAGPALSDQMLDDVKNQLAIHNIEVKNLDSLSSTQVSQMHLILSTSEDDCCKAAMIENLVSERKACVATPQLRAQVAGQFKEHGIAVDVDSISGPDLLVIEAVLTSNAKEGSKKAQIERILAVDSPMVGNAQLRASVESCVNSVNAKVDNLDALSPEQLIQIELVAGGSGSESEKRMMIENIADQ
jgi:hypothetical protein